MPVSYLEIDGIRYEVPPTRSAIRLLDDDGVTELFAIDSAGNIGASTFTGAVTFSGAVTFTGAATFTGAVSMTNASISMTALPAADPTVAGRLYTTTGAVMVSAG